MTEPSVQNLLTFIGFNLTIATLFFALVYSYSKNLLDKVYQLKDKIKCEQDKDEASKVCAYFYCIDLITFSALSLLVFSAIFGSLYVLGILKLVKEQTLQLLMLIPLIVYFGFSIYYMLIFRKIRKLWKPAETIFWLVLIIEILLIVSFGILNFVANFMYLLVAVIIFLTVHIVLCLYVSIKYTPMTALLKLWDLPGLCQEDENEATNKQNESTGKPGV